MKVLVSGGTGLVGRYVVEELLAKNGVYRKLWDDQGHHGTDDEDADDADDDDDDDEEDEGEDEEA